jgi:hypothetical protein
MGNIPAICLNPKCGAIFPSGINFTGAGNVFLSCGTGPCSRCGSMGRIPDGRYDSFENTIFAELFNINDAEIIDKAIEKIRQLINVGTAPAAIVSNMKEQVP